MAGEARLRWPPHVSVRDKKPGQDILQMTEVESAILERVAGVLSSFLRIESENDILACQVNAYA